MMLKDLVERKLHKESKRRTGDSGILSQLQDARWSKRLRVAVSSKQLLHKISRVFQAV